MSSTGKKDALESLVNLLKDNKKRVDALAKKMEENSALLLTLNNLVEKNEKRVDTLEKKLRIY